MIDHPAHFVWHKRFRIIAMFAMVAGPWFFGPDAFIMASLFYIANENDDTRYRLEHGLLGKNW